AKAVLGPATTNCPEALWTVCRSEVRPALTLTGAAANASIAITQTQRIAVNFMMEQYASVRSEREPRNYLSPDLVFGAALSVFVDFVSPVAAGLPSPPPEDAPDSFFAPCL